MDNRKSLRLADKFSRGYRMLTAAKKVEGTTTGKLHCTVMFTVYMFTVLVP